MGYVSYHGTILYSTGRVNRFCPSTAYFLALLTLEPPFTKQSQGHSKVNGPCFLIDKAIVKAHAGGRRNKARLINDHSSVCTKTRYCRVSGHAHPHPHPSTTSAGTLQSCKLDLVPSRANKPQPDKTWREMHEARHRITHSIVEHAMQWCSSCSARGGGEDPSTTTAHEYSWLARRGRH